MTGKDRGRPQIVSLAALEDAAGELFLEQGYRATSIDDIAQRAGISRASFFNHCSTKSDVLWVDADTALDTLEMKLRNGVTLGEALQVVAALHPDDRIPLIATQAEAMGLGPALAESAGVRVSRLQAAVASAGVDPGDVWLVTGALIGVAQQWATGTSPRFPLTELLNERLTPLQSIVGSKTRATLF
ncbi:MAG: TetR/AcrR family transcriptional regulator [Pontimonas sp.]